MFHWWWANTTYENTCSSMGVMPTPHSCEVLTEWMKTWLMEWNINRKVMIIIVDNDNNNALW